MSAIAEENPWAGQGAVLLDIGGDVGALVVTMPKALVGTEVEIRPFGWQRLAHVHHPHVGVVDRLVPDGSVPSLVYPAVSAGRYELWVIGEETGPALVVDVLGGVVTHADWPTGP